MAFGHNRSIMSRQVKNKENEMMLNTKHDDAPVICGYARTSTYDQTTAMQIDALERHGCDLVFEDAGVSGGIHPMKRAQFQAAMKALTGGGVLVVWKLDRLGRSLSGIIETIDHLNRADIRLVSLTENIQTDTAMGKAFLHFIALLAELERGLIRERTLEGLQAAKARGAKLGRPYALSDRVLEDAYEKWTAKVLTLAEIAMCLSVSERTLNRGFSRL